FRGADFMNTTLDDEAAIPIDQGNSPFHGTFKPQGLLSSFNDEDPNGVWQLEIVNDGLVTGTLTAWSLRFTCGEPSAQTGTSGNYAFVKVRPGNYVVREVLPGGRQQTAPTAGFYRGTVSSGQSVTGLCFGNFRDGDGDGVND